MLSVMEDINLGVIDEIQELKKQRNAIMLAHY